MMSATFVFAGEFIGFLIAIWMWPEITEATRRAFLGTFGAFFIVGLGTLMIFATAQARSIPRLERTLLNAGLGADGCFVAIGLLFALLPGAGGTNPTLRTGLFLIVYFGCHLGLTCWRLARVRAAPKREAKEATRSG